MPINFQSVREFVRTHGDVIVTVSKPEIKILKNGEVDTIDLVEKATDFFFQGKHYTRQEFEERLST